VVGVAGGLVGLIVGLSMTGSSDSGSLTTKVASLTDQRNDLRAEVRQLKDSGVDQRDVDKQIADAVARAEAEAAASQKQALAEAVARERRRASRLVADAKGTGAGAHQSSTGGDGDQSGATDPRFSTCAAANDAGYGPYTSGVDAEYSWYQDRDQDGVVCEP
jgi:hypothetical protein